MNGQTYGAPTTAWRGETYFSLMAGTAKKPGRTSAPERNPKWDALMARTVNTLHPNARMRFVSSFLLSLPFFHPPAAAGSLPAGLLLSLDPVLPALERCAGCCGAGRCAGEAMDYPLMNRAVAEGRALGIKVFLLLAQNHLAFHAEILDLGLRYQDCLFILLGPSALLEEEFAADIAASGNIAPAMNVEGDLKAGSRFGQAAKQARASGLPFGFACGCHQGNRAVIRSRGFLEQQIEDGALFGLYYRRQPPRGLEADRAAKVKVKSWIQAARESSPIPLIDLQQDVHLHWVSSSIRHLTLRESLEQFLLDPKLQPFYGDAAHRRICPRRTDRFWLRQTLFSALTGPAFPADRTLAGV